MHLLIVEDRSEDRELIERQLRRHLGDVQLTEAPTEDALRQALEQGPYDLILTDYDLGWTNGLQVLDQVQKRFPGVPVVMFTESGNEEVAVAGMRAGLSDYLLKKHLARLPAVVEGSLQQAELRHKYDQAVEELRRSEERYRIVAGTIVDLGYELRVEPDGRFVVEWVGGRLLERIGYTAADIAAIGGWKELIHPDDRPAVRENRSRLLAGEVTTSEYRIIARDGEVRWVRAVEQPAWDPAREQVVRIYGGVQDVTAQRQVEYLQRQVLSNLESRVQERTLDLTAANETLQTQTEELQIQQEELQVQTEELREQADELQANERWLREALADAEAGRRLLDALMDNLPEGVTIADKEQKVQRVSRYGQELLGGEHAGMSAEEVAARWTVYYADGVTPMPPQDLPLVRAIQQGEVVKDVELVQVNTRGEHLPLLCNAAPIRDAAGEITGGIVAWRDISERKKDEARVRRQNAVLAGINRILLEALTAETEEEVGRACLAVAEEVTQSKFGFVGEVNARTGRLDSIAISNPGREECGLADQEGHGKPVPEGFEIRGLYGRVLQDSKAFFTNNPSSHSDSVGVPPGHPSLEAFLGVPLRYRGKTIGMVGLGNREAGYSQEQSEAAEALAPAVVQALMSKRAEVEREELLRRVRQDAETRATLLREVNHRVKNNLAAIIGLLYAQSNRPGMAAEKGYQEAILEVTHRIEGLSVVHGMLSSSQWTPLRLDELAERIIQSTLQAVPEGKVTVEVAPTPIRVSPDQAHTLALVVNELALNVAKHVLQTGAAIHVSVSATEQDGTAVLVFHDNGPGYPEEVLTGKRLGVGLGLLRNLVRQNLRGQLQLRNREGAEAEVSFPLQVET